MKEEVRKLGVVGRPMKRTKAIDPEIAEKAVMAKTGIAPERIEEKLLKGMTASDISAQALEYISDIELIRVKNGRLQGGLSGELRKRASCLEDMIRAFQAKVESNGDPTLLKHKMGELLDEIRAYKKEEEKRKREMSELREIIRDLKKENKSMREEMRKIREGVVRKESLDRERSLERSEVKGSLKKKRNDSQPGKNEHDLPDITSKSHVVVLNVQDDTTLSRDGWPANPEVGWSQNEEEMVMRPSLGSRSVPIPVNLKQKETSEIIVSRQIKALEESRDNIRQIEKERSKGKETERSGKLRVIENVQLVKPREEKREMGNQQDRKAEGTEEDTWTHVTRKGRKKGKGEGGPESTRARD